jgi:2-amino-4-hydroxy-6-hydroxymethyldihydropteridine diphosphokinase
LRLTIKKLNQIKKMNTAIVLLGSNSNPNEMLEQAKEKLSAFYEIISESSILQTKAKGKYKYDFSNQAIKILSDEPAEATRFVFKQIETELGRNPESKKDGIMPIDIDFIIWNDVVVDNDYHQIDFVKKCVDEIL